MWGWLVGRMSFLGVGERASMADEHTCGAIWPKPGIDILCVLLVKL